MLGCTFIAAAPSSPKEHIYFVISDPSVGSGEVVFVNLTKWRDDKDQVCIIEPGDHPFVKERSVVFYSRLVISSEASLTEAISKGLFRIGEPANKEIIAKIQAGCCSSRDTSPRAKELVRLTVSKHSAAQITDFDL